VSIDFIEKHVKLDLPAKFVHTHLPDAKKPFNLKAAHPQELTIKEVATMAAEYNIETSPKTIEDGTNAFFALCCRLIPRGHTIKTILANFSLKIPGEYNGSETHLPEGVYPVVKAHVGAFLQEFVKDNVNVTIDGHSDLEGRIAEAYDEKTLTTNDVCTIDEILTITGNGMKIEWDEAHKDDAGLFLIKDNTPDVKVTKVVVNEPRTLKIIVPTAKMEVGEAYRLKIVTQSSPSSSSNLLKDPRTIISDFTLTARQ
jgi:hypothetical protein